VADSLTFPADFKTDTEFLTAALDEFRQANGFHESIQYGDLDTQSQTNVRRRAQALKKEARP
jgi:hypothetical protein